MSLRRLLANRAVHGFALAAVPLATVQTPALAQQPYPTAGSLIASVDPASLVFQEDAKGDVNHVQSGMTCVMGAEGFRLTSLAVFPTEKRGDDVACGYDLSAGKVTLFATRTKGRGLQEEVQGTLQAMRQIHPQSSAAAAPPVARYPGLKDPVAFAIRINRESGDLISSTWMAECAGWFVKVRATYPESTRKDQETLVAVAAVVARTSMKCGARKR